MTRIVVINPQPAVRAGLAMLLRTEPGLVPVGSAADAADGLELVERAPFGDASGEWRYVYRATRPCAVGEMALDAGESLLVDVPRPE
jgi:hypothetical protein